MKKPHVSIQGHTLGQVQIQAYRFPRMEERLQELGLTAPMHDWEKVQKLSALLYEYIDAAPVPCFCLVAVVEFFDKVEKLGILEHFTFSKFELWLNVYSNLSKAENYRIRGKIMGKYLPREDFQALFPIGMGKIYAGSHYVTAHSSPDIDTTVASFWGWVDAFTAKVSDGLHLWNLPGGDLVSHVEVELLFNDIFGKNLIKHFAKTKTNVTLTALDLMSLKGFQRKKREEPIGNVDLEKANAAVIVTDGEGFYQGDWRAIDFEAVRQIVLILHQALRSFEVQLHFMLISLFSAEELTKERLLTEIEKSFFMKIAETEAVQELSNKQRQHFHDYLQKVLQIAAGIDVTFYDFAVRLEEKDLPELRELFIYLQEMAESSLFDEEGNLIENRQRIFRHLTGVFSESARAVQSVRASLDNFDNALSIKRHVIGLAPRFISHRAEVEEIRSKIQDQASLTVVTSDHSGRLFPLGVIHASDLYQPILGTVSLRDFCNREETKIPSYMEVISVIDHHKVLLATSTPPMALINDTQSSNTAIAEIAMKISDRFSLGGMTLQEIDEQIGEVTKDLNEAASRRILAKLLQKKTVCQLTNYFVDPVREYVEALHFLCAILDDTDLLSKASKKDLEVLVMLLNRMKSLSVRKEVEVIHLDDVALDEKFLTYATRKILQNSEMYSVYRRVYRLKEERVEQEIKACVQEQNHALFADTKIQNSCTRVGQTKLFPNNFTAFHKQSEQIRKRWAKEAGDFFRDRPEVDLYMHMISTISGAEDQYAGTEAEYTHKDELWFWIPSLDTGAEHLKFFLQSFRKSGKIAQANFELELRGAPIDNLDQIFSESFLPVPRVTRKETSQGLPIAILRFKPGLLNSRKAMIAPFLPKG